MGKLKPWQIALFAVAVGAAAFGVVWVTGQRGVKMADTVTMVDVTTGKLYEVSVAGRKGIILPGTNPDTGKATLMPVRKDESGAWVVSRRYLPDLRDVDGQVTAVDASTGRVRVAD